MLLGCDVSFWQDDDNTVRQIDFAQMRRRGAEFVIVRGGQNIGRDPDWRYNWGEAGEHGLLRGAYWVHDYRKPVMPQTAALAELVSSYPVEIPLWWDLEYVALWGPRPRRENLLPALRTALPYLTNATGRKPILYMNPDMIKNILRVSAQDEQTSWLLDYPLAIAHYGVDQPSFGPWAQWHFWQFTKSGPGLEFGVESKDIDLDLWNGDMDSLRAFCGLAAIEPPEPVSLAEWAQSLDGWARTQGYKGPRLA